MAITTDNEKLAVMEWGQVWEPGLPLSPGALGTDDLQQLLWGYPGVLWAPPALAIPSYFDLRSPIFAHPEDLVSLLEAGDTDLLSDISQPFDLRGPIFDIPTDRVSTIDDSPTDLEGEL